MRRARGTAFGLLAAAVILAGYFAMHSSASTAGAHGRGVAMADAASSRRPVDTPGDHAFTAGRRPGDHRMPMTSILHVAGLCAALVVTVASARRRTDAWSGVRNHLTVRVPAIRSWVRLLAVPPPLALGISRC